MRTPQIHTGGLSKDWCHSSLFIRGTAVEMVPLNTWATSRGLKSSEEWGIVTALLRRQTVKSAALFFHIYIRGISIIKDLSHQQLRPPLGQKAAFKTVKSSNNIIHILMERISRKMSLTFRFISTAQFHDRSQLTIQWRSDVSRKCRIATKHDILWSLKGFISTVVSMNLISITTRLLRRYHQIHF